MLSRLMPKESNFFDLFDKQVGYAVESAKFFKEVVARKTLDELVHHTIREIEHQGDRVVHEIVEQLDKTFITPFDREDIHALAKEIDDIIDIIYSIIKKLKVYNLEGADKNLLEFADVIEQSVSKVSCAVRGIRHSKNLKPVLEACREVNALENLGDSLRDKVISELFIKFKNDPILVIKWKEVYQDAETVLDICEDAVHVVESIIVKHA